MTANYVLLEKITVGAAGASSVTFSGIPQTGYTDLVVKVSARSSRTAFAQDDLSYKFNSSSTGYNYIQLRGSGSAVISTNPGSVGYNYAGQINSNASTSNTFSNVEIYIPNYTGSANKSSSVDGVQENNATEAYATLVADLWSNTAAITSITLDLAINGNSFVQGSTFYLYGVAKLGTTPAIVPYATGGDTIMTDGTYWWHIFNSSGTFTPVPGKNLTCDYLVIAGGGGGSTGGGGAGGYLTGSGINVLANTNVSVTVGGGGASGPGGTGAAATSGSNSVFSSITATGGGGAGGGDNAASGGSGGGGGYAFPGPSTGGSGTSGQGNAGGGGTYFDGRGGGGGGAGAAGTAAVGNTPGNGGNGLASSITGSSVTRAGGGAGGSLNGSGTPGTGGGGTGGNSPTAGTANTGGGGGGGGDNAGGNGGSGIVIVRYLV